MTTVQAKLLIERGADVNYQRRLDSFCSLHFSAQKPVAQFRT